MKLRVLLISTFFLFSLVSCERTEREDYADVTLTVNIPAALETKAISDGSQVNIVHYVAFGPAGNVVHSGSTGISVDQAAAINVTLVKHVDYTFVFWAHKGDDAGSHAAYDLTTFYTDGVVKVSYDGDANDEERDAFYANPTIKIDDTQASLNQTVFLYRPFAQINFLHKDYQVVEDAGIHTTLTSMVEISGIPDVLNGKDGTVSGSAVTSLDHDSVPTEKYVRSEAAAGVRATTTYGWYSMNYVLAAKGNNDNITVTGKFKHGQSATEIVVPVTEVPYSRNYRTNIIGSFLTENTTLTVKIDPDFVDADEDGEPDDMNKYI